MTDEPSIAVINLAQRIAVLDDDRIIPITNILDIAGKETDDVEECAAFVAKVTDDCWLTYRADDFEKQVWQ